MEEPVIPPPSKIPPPADPPAAVPKPASDSVYWWLFGLTTFLVAACLLGAGLVTYITPSRQTTQKPANLQNITPTPSQNQASGFSVTSPAPSTAPTTAVTASSETWVVKGIAIGKGGAAETGDPFMAEVIPIPAGGYRMYYGWAGPAGATAIKSATSQDGKTWTIESGYRLEGASSTSDREHVVSGPSIVKLPDGRLRMYYQSSPQITQGQAPAFHVRSAVSSDGLTFTREGVRIDIAPYTTTTGLSLAGHGTYFIARDGTYVGIFSANVSGQGQTPSSLVIATSKDGLTFSNFKLLYSQWHDPVVLKTATGYIIYATYLTEKQGKAISTDGLNWPTTMTDITMQDSSGKRLTEGNSGVGDIGGVVLPDGSIRLYVNYGSQQKSDSIAYLEKL